MSDGLAPSLPLEVIERLDTHAAHAWPASFAEPVDGGWLLRATPGVQGFRLNHALTPCRALSASEIETALRRSSEFAARHGIHHGLQVSPLHVHPDLLELLADRGWRIGGDVVVQTVELTEVAGGAIDELGLTVTTEPDRAWLAAWGTCDPGHRGPAHVDTVLKRLAGRARFCRYKDVAVGIAVPGDGLVGLFGLAVAAERRRQGIGSKLVRAMLASVDAETAYLQVDAENAAGLALYESLGFREAYRYRHCVAPS